MFLVRLQRRNIKIHSINLADKPILKHIAQKYNTVTESYLPT